MTGRPRIRLWLIGLAAFVVVILLSQWITSDGVVPGIMDHQSAGSADRVDAIQRIWREEDVRGRAIAAMIADLIFIGLYGVGSYIAGISLMVTRRYALRAIGLTVAASAVIFVLTDYAETALELVQLLRDSGLDWMAQTAATVRPLKVGAFVTTFVGVVVGLGLNRLAVARA